MAHAKVAISGGVSATAGERLRLLLRAGNERAVKQVKDELVKQNGNVTRASRALGINYRTFMRTVHQLRLEPFIDAVRSTYAKGKVSSIAYHTHNSDTNVIAAGVPIHHETPETDPWPF